MTTNTPPNIGPCDLCGEVDHHLTLGLCQACAATHHTPEHTQDTAPPADAPNPQNTKEATT